MSSVGDSDRRALDEYLKSIVEFGIYGNEITGMSPEALRAANAAATAPSTEPELEDAKTAVEGEPLVGEDNEEQEETRDERRARKQQKKANKSSKKKKKKKKKTKKPPTPPPLENENENEDEEDDGHSIVTAFSDLPEAPASIGEVMNAAAEVEARQRIRGPTRRQQEMEDALRREHAYEIEDEAESTVQSEIDKVVADLNQLLIETEPKSKMVAFLDLEWHTLDKKAPEDMVVGKELSLMTAHICQICAISADYSVRFNQYVSYRKLKEPWCRLVRDNVMEFSPQDDPQIALPVETVMEQFVAAFPKDTLFLSYGTTDAPSIFKTLSATHDFDLYNEQTEIPAENRARREAVLKTMIDNRWRFGNARHWIQEQGKKLQLGFALSGSLGRLYDILFHHSLWMSYPTLSAPSTIVTPDAALFTLDEKLVTTFPSADREKFGLVPREWLLVQNDRNRASDAHKNCFPQFWPTKHLEPVFHVAHTDTVMLINCVAILSLAGNKLVTDVTKVLVDNASRIDQIEVKREFKTIFKIPLVPQSVKERKYDSKLQADWAKIESKQEESAYNSLATSVIAKTWFFRKFQLALSASAEEDLYTFYERANLRGRKSAFQWSRTAKELKRHVYVLACKAAGLSPNKEGADDITLHDELYEVERVVRFEMDDKDGAGYWIQWKGYPDEQDQSWFKVDDLGGSAELIEEYLKSPFVTDEEVTKIRDNGWDKPAVAEAPPPAPPKKKPNKAAAAPDPGERIDRELKEVLEWEERDAEDPEEFADKDKTHYFSLMQQHPTDQNKQYHQLVMSRRSGKFTDKVKAIRSFLIKQASATNDNLLLNTLVQSEHPFAEKRKLKFPMDPVKNYSGLPWFSLQTSVVEPHTEMLHTLMCRNLSDPDSVERRTRNFAELDVTLWEFDLIVKARIFLNTRFRFCKECKEYTNIQNLRESDDESVNELVAQFRTAARVVSPLPAVLDPILPPPAVAASAAPSSVASLISGSTNSRRSRLTVQTLTRPLNYQTPLTPLVSFFALRSAS